MREIIRVTADRQTLYMRVPRQWAKAQKLRRGSYLVCRCHLDGALVVNTYEKEMRNGPQTDDGEGGQD